MNTFLPYPDIRKSLEALDKRRLVKQRLEASQLCKLEYERVFREKAGLPELRAAWINHPAAMMYRGYLPFLRLYYNISIDVCNERGIANNSFEYFILPNKAEKPWWFGVPEFHWAMKCNLLAKDFNFYSREFRAELSTLVLNQAYYWPRAVPYLRLGNTQLHFNAYTKEFTRLNSR